MSQFVQDSSTGSSDSSSSSSSGSESELDFDVVSPSPVKSNEAGSEAQSSNIEKEAGGNSKEKKKTPKGNRKTKQGNKEKAQEHQKEKLTPERTVHLVKKIIAKNKRRAVKDKKKFNILLRSASASARQYKAISNKAAKRTI